MSKPVHDGRENASAAIESARPLIEEGRPYDAEMLLRAELEKEPENQNLLSHLGVALHDQGRLSECVEILNQAVNLDPSDAFAQVALGASYMRLSDPQSAIKHYTACLQSDPTHPVAMLGLADALARTYQYEASADCARRMLEHDSGDISASVILARCLRHLGSVEEAVTVLDGIDRIEGNVESLLAAPEVQWKLDLERARCLVDIGDHSAAFYFFEKANARFREANPGWKNLYALFQKDVWAQQVYLDALCKRMPKVKGAEAPLFAKPQAFVAGFPRSGTTLLRTILGSHPELGVVQESDAFGDACVSIPEGLTTSPTPEHVLHTARNKYYADMNARTTDRSYRVLVDIHPYNTRLAAWMTELFPHAKLVLMVRHPCDVCLSAYMQGFELNTLTSGMLSLEDTVQSYVQMMSLWNDAVKALSLDVLVVRYEDIVSDFQPEVTRVLNHVGVEWDIRVSEFNRNARSDQPKTASAHQVIKPLYDTASYRWKKCRSIIEPHFESLAPFIEAYGYDLD
ncbi:MAG: tetratricopeptide repeat-containing sulfotransferase family protein [Rhodospirillaceae bacterium]